MRKWEKPNFGHDFGLLDTNYETAKFHFENGGCWLQTYLLILNVWCLFFSCTETRLISDFFTSSLIILAALYFDITFLMIKRLFHGKIMLGQICPVGHYTHCFISNRLGYFLVWSFYSECLNCHSNFLFSNFLYI